MTHWEFEPSPVFEDATRIILHRSNVSGIQKTVGVVRSLIEIPALIGLLNVRRLRRGRPAALRFLDGKFYGTILRRESLIGRPVLTRPK